jgi:hypothetical protein
VRVSPSTVRRLSNSLYLLDGLVMIVRQARSIQQYLRAERDDESRALVQIARRGSTRGVVALAAGLVAAAVTSALAQQIRAAQPALPGRRGRGPLELDSASL